MAHWYDGCYNKDGTPFTKNTVTFSEPFHKDGTRFTDKEDQAYWDNIYQEKKDHWARMCREDDEGGENSENTWCPTCNRHIGQNNRWANNDHTRCEGCETDSMGRFVIGDIMLGWLFGGK